MNDNMESMKLDRKVTVTAYAPKTFKKIREMTGISDEELWESIDPAKNIQQIQNSGLGAGASGMFFFKSYDKKFILKTMNSDDLH